MFFILKVLNVIVPVALSDWLWWTATGVTGAGFTTVEDLVVGLQRVQVDVLVTRPGPCLVDIGQFHVQAPLVTNVQCVVFAYLNARSFQRKLLIKSFIYFNCEEKSFYIKFSNKISGTISYKIDQEEKIGWSTLK